jgi:lysophospholipase L1-like esterase
MTRDAVAHVELNARADLQALVQKGQWWPIDCQLNNRTQNGVVLWNHVANVGWIAGSAMKTYTDGRLQGSPHCAKPGPNHVYFKQRWALTKEYRVAHRAAAYDRPGGAPVGKVLDAGAWTTTSCHQLHRGRQWVFIDFAGAGSGYVKAAALRFWQRGLPAGMPACVKPPPPVRTWVAMGDSYASGQGANDYSGGSCRRSANAYWALLHGRLRHGLTSGSSDFVACSGATTAEVRAHQLSALDPTTRLVTISVGGDNLGFSGVVKSCVKPGGTSCKEALRDHVNTSSLRRLRASLRAIYSDIRSRAASATVLVLGYPQLTPPDHIDGCGAMDSSDAPYLHRAGVRLNRSIRRVVGSRRGFRFIGLVSTFQGHPACDDGAADWINGVNLKDTQESFHPNAPGHRAIAAHLAAVAPGFFR